MQNNKISKIEIPTIPYISSGLMKNDLNCNSPYKKEDFIYSCPFSRPSSLPNSSSVSVSNSFEKDSQQRIATNNITKNEILRQLNTDNLLNFEDVHQDIIFQQSKLISTNALSNSGIVSPKELNLSYNQNKNQKLSQAFKKNATNNFKKDVNDEGYYEIDILSNREDDEGIFHNTEYPLLEHSLSASRPDSQIYRQGTCFTRQYSKDFKVTDTFNSQDFGYSNNNSPSKTNTFHNNFNRYRGQGKENNLNFQNNQYSKRDAIPSLVNAKKTEIYNFQDAEVSNRIPVTSNCEDESVNMNFNINGSCFYQKKDYCEYKDLPNDLLDKKSAKEGYKKKLGKSDFLDFIPNNTNNSIKGMMLNYSDTKKNTSSSYIYNPNDDKTELYYNTLQENSRESLNDKNNFSRIYNEKLNVHQHKPSKNTNSNTCSLDLTFDSNSHSFLGNSEVSRFSKISDLSGFGITRNHINEENKHKYRNTCNLIKIFLNNCNIVNEDRIKPHLPIIDEISNTSTKKFNNINFNNSNKFIYIEIFYAYNIIYSKSDKLAKILHNQPQIKHREGIYYSKIHE